MRFVIFQKISFWIYYNFYKIILKRIDSNINFKKQNIIFSDKLFILKNKNVINYLRHQILMNS